MAITVSQPIIASGKPRIDASYGPWADWDAAATGLTTIYKTNSSGINVPARILVCVNDVDYILTEQIIDSYTNDEIRDAYNNNITLQQKQVNATTLQTKCTPYAQGGGITEEEVNTKIQTAISVEENRSNVAYANKATQNSVNGNIIVTSNRKIYRSSDGSLPTAGENVFIYDDDDETEHTMINQSDRLTTMDIENVLGYPAVGYEFRRQEGASSADDYRVEAFKNVNLTKNDIWIGTATQYRSALLFNSAEVANKTLVIITADGSGIVNVSGENIVLPSRPIVQNGEE